jgi:biopolymer transport protein TolQ
MQGFSIVEAVMHASVIVKCVLIVMVALSVITWGLFLEKSSKIKFINMKNKSFEKDFWSGVTLEDFYSTMKRKLHSSKYCEVFCNIMEEWVLSEIVENPMTVEYTKAGIRERIAKVVEKMKIRVASDLSDGLGLMSAIASTSPFVGLFGTVFGIMDSLVSISKSGSVSLIAVAPGMAEALFSTAVGLFVAIPAVAFYSILARKISILNNSIDLFALDVHNILSREMDKISIKNYNAVNK